MVLVPVRALSVIAALLATAVLVGPAPVRAQAEATEYRVLTPAQGWVDGVTDAWLHAVGSNGKTQNLKPAAAQAALHAQLSAGQASVESLLQKLVNDDAPTDAKKTDTIMRVTSVFNLMDQSLPWPN